MKLYAVIDTNVLVSALLRWYSIPGAILEQALAGGIVPVVSNGILAEYDNVLHRRKFSFAEEDIQAVIEEIRKRAVFLEPEPVKENLPDPGDVVFYAVTLAARKQEDAFLVTGNIRHFPSRSYIVTPREFLNLLESILGEG